MLFEICLFSFLFSFFGMLILLLNSFPRLSQIELEQKENFFKKLKENLQEKIKSQWNKEVLLEKLLRKVRVINLKLDFKVSSYLQGLAQKKWEKIKKEEFWKRLKRSKKKTRPE